MSKSNDQQERCANCGGPQNFALNGTLQSVCYECNNQALLKYSEYDPNSPHVPIPAEPVKVETCPHCNQPIEREHEHEIKGQDGWEGFWCRAVKVETCGCDCDLCAADVCRHEHPPASDTEQAEMEERELQEWYRISSSDLLSDFVSRTPRTRRKERT